MMWNTDKTNLPKDGSLLDIIITENDDGQVFATCGTVHNGKIMFPMGKDIGLGDITDKVIRWRKVPNIIHKEGKGLYWDNESDEVEVVKCKDCKYSKSTIFEDQFWCCKKNSPLSKSLYPRDPDWYCADGENKER